MLSLVGLGLGDEKDITVRGLEIVRSADVVYLEAYTAVLLDTDETRLTAFYGREVIVADRDAVESGSILNPITESKKHVALLVVGDPYGATTHSDLVLRCHELSIPVQSIFNTSILNAVGVCGLQLYRYGQVLSLCFWTDTWKPDSWYERFVANRKLGLHTLFLLDIKMKEQSPENLARGRKIFEPPRFMTVNQAVEQILAVEAEKQTGAVSPASKAVGLARVGGRTQRIVSGTLEELRHVDFGAPLHSLVVAGELHECETAHLDIFNVHKITPTQQAGPSGDPSK